jgi:hypothetical protein
MAGARHTIAGRFGVFGETGLGRSSSKSEAAIGPSVNRSHFWSIRSTVGAILFF